MRFQPSHTFRPSAYSYGADEDVEEVEEPAEEESSDSMAQVTAAIPAIKSFLGIDDPREQVAKLENRLRDLKYGNAAERTAATLASGALTLQGAIEKTENKLAQAKEEAFQTATRDWMYTGLAVAGVAVGGMMVVWLGTKAWSQYQEGKIRQAELKRLQGS
jgi:hypothetical protein